RPVGRSWRHAASDRASPFPPRRGKGTQARSPRASSRPATDGRIHARVRRNKSKGERRCRERRASLEYAERTRPNYNWLVPEADPVDITGLLKAWHQGDQTAFDQLIPLVYAELRRQARRHMRKERSGLTLQSTAVVHEVYLRLTRARKVDCQDRVHFFALAAQVTRRVLVDAARARTALKRGGAVLPTEHSSAVDLDG